MSPAFGNNLHLCLPFGIIPVVVDESEVSSIIAFSLASREYANCLSNFASDVTCAEQSINILRDLNDLGIPESSDYAQFHIDLQFCDSVANFYCKVYCAKYFTLLRECIFAASEEQFIRSLSRCEAWQPTGGKSGATFFRTLDGRFILKQMSRYEVQSFIKFAPAYFKHVASVCLGKKATSLVKIFGVYRVGFKNTQNGTAYKMDLAVMEYLFYDRNISEIYDLKGSLRNRWASEKQHQTDIVLLDENLLEKVCTDSFYLHPFSKLTLNATINGDTKLLSENHVMDYSLLVGIDEEKSELVLGIIDYLRTYTWDKKIESWVKSVSVSGQPPTVISPELYRQRFVESMDVYFPVSPDQWSVTFPIEL
ncbi:unnamed protein product [Soboliphyme baturini]|uniref:PIPK domain-containing protein n=1 Tax=Soboliphyme baturini TaxID=241478 RepID=A0A183IL72_9BILA|nr:unnamed protein product [Soboliphyme baturini]